MIDLDALRIRDGEILGQSGDYARARGARFYWEVHGEGPPLLLMHGAWATIESLAFQVDALAEQFEVVLIERRGHGRTPDTPGRFSYRQGAEDMIGVLEELGYGRVHLVGWSDGAIIGLMISLARPEIVDRYVSIGGNYHFRGYVREFARKMEESSFNSLNPSIRSTYEMTSPDGPDHFPVVFNKIKAMSSSQPRFTKRDLRGMITPALIMSGDADVIALEHTVNFFSALPCAQLSIVPGTTHMLPVEKPGVVNNHIIQFLLAENLRRTGDGIFKD